MCQKWSQLRLFIKVPKEALDTNIDKLNYEFDIVRI